MMGTKPRSLAPLEILFNAIRTAARGEMAVQPEMMARILSYTASPISTSSSESVPSYMQLTQREQEVLAGVARGERSKEIAAAYLTNIYTKLNVDSRASAIAVAMERGLLLQQPEPGNSKSSK